MIHLYAVVEGLDELPSVPGLADAPLERLRVEDLDVVVSTATTDLSELSETAVLRHAAVVEELMARSDAVLPGRLSRGFADGSELERAVRAESGRLKTALRRVRGCVELGLRVLQPEGKDASARVLPLKGAEYLRARLAEERELEQTAVELHEPLARLARASVRRAGRIPGQLFEGAYLLPTDAVEGFRDELARLQSLRPDLVFVCTGPWPPYSFSSAEEQES